MTFKEWLASLQPKREQTPGEDFADSIGLIVLMAMVCLVIFI